MQKLLFFDIDNTLTTFEHHRGMERLIPFLGRKFGRDKKIIAIIEEMNEMFGRITQGAISQEELRHLLLNTLAMAASPQQLSAIKWSRELWMLQGCRKYMGTYDGVVEILRNYPHYPPVIAPRILHEAACTYWQGIKENTRMFGDAQEVLRWLVILGLRSSTQWILALVSASDGVLKFTEGSTDNSLGSTDSFASFVYDAEYAAMYKKTRLLRELLARTENVFIGDPVSKPEPAFWEGVLKNLNYQQGHDLAVMVGDSYENDMRNLARFGIHGVLLDRAGVKTPHDAPEAEFIINELGELITLLPKMERAHANGKGGAA